MKLLFVILFSTSTWALSPFQNELNKVYKENKIVFRQCLNGQISKNKQMSCIDTVKFFYAACAVKKETIFQRVDRATQMTDVNDSCDLVFEAESKISTLFEVDTKACVSGFETLPDRLVTFSKIKNLFDESAVYMYEKNSCKEFRTYVNLCVFIDGQLKGTLPTSYQMLPKVQFGKKEQKICTPDTMSQDGTYQITKDLAARARHPKNNIFAQLIQDYQARMSANKGAKSPECEDVRNAYANLGCDFYEQLTEGEPNYISAEKMQKNRERKSDLLNGLSRTAN